MENKNRKTYENPRIKMEDIGLIDPILSSGVGESTVFDFEDYFNLGN